MDCIQEHTESWRSVDARRVARPDHSTDNALVPRRGGAVREGLAAGAVAATGVALWFAVADLLFGVPVSTPHILGLGLASLLGVSALAGSAAAAVLQYTLVHYAAFMALGVAAAAVVRRAQQDATVLAGALLGFVVAEASFFGFLALLHQTTHTGALTWPQLVAGNVVGCLLLGAWLWRSHPELRGEVAEALGDAG
jgi:hypothetical protein